MEAGRARAAARSEILAAGPKTPRTAGTGSTFFSPATEISQARGSAFRAAGTAERTTDFQNVDCSAGLAEKDAAGNLARVIDRVTGCVDDGDVRARRPEPLGDIPTGQIAPQLDIGDDDIDPLPALQVPKRLSRIARFQNLIAGAPQRLDEVQPSQRVVFNDENRDYRMIRSH